MSGTGRRVHDVPWIAPLKRCRQIFTYIHTKPVLCILEAYVVRGECDSECIVGSGVRLSVGQNGGALAYFRALIVAEL